MIAGLILAVAVVAAGLVLRVDVHGRIGEITVADPTIFPPGSHLLIGAAHDVTYVVLVEQIDSLHMKIALPDRRAWRWHR